MKQNTVHSIGQQAPCRITTSLPYLNQIAQGDCCVIMQQLPAEAVDFILTDPPYLARYTSRDGRPVPNDDNDRWLKPAFAEMYRLLRPDRFAVSFYGWPHADKFLTAYRAAGFRVVGHLVFRKRYSSAASYVAYQHEMAYLLVKGQPPKSTSPLPDVREWEYTGNKLHPTQKPLSALLPLVEEFSRPGDVVLDPFCGSGSSLRAAQMFGRQFIGCEIDPNYARIASHRLRHRLH